MDRIGRDGLPPLRPWRNAAMTKPLLDAALRGFQIDSTRALDGTQTDSWKDIDARWTYHPDNGLRLTLVDRKIAP